MSNDHQHQADNHHEFSCTPTPAHLLDQLAATARDRGATRNAVLVAAHNTSALADVFATYAAEHPGAVATVDWFVHQLRHHAHDQLAIAQQMPVWPRITGTTPKDTRP